MMSAQQSESLRKTASVPPVLIVGTGALASLFAARFAAAGIAFTMLGSWRQGLKALQQNGVTLVEPDGKKTVYPARATNDPRECIGTRIALVLVKSWGTERAANQLAGCLAQDGLALTLQNGFGNRETLESHLGAERVAQGVTTLGANLAAPGVVRVAGEGKTTLGTHPRLALALNLLHKAGFDLDVASNLDSLVWGKLVINSAINPLTALIGVPNGELLERPMARALMATVARETALVAAALGVRLPYPDSVSAVEGVAQRTAANRSSMLQDVSRGAPTEIDAICGAIVRAGERTGVPTPANRVLWQLLKSRSTIGDYPGSTSFAIQSSAAETQALPLPKP